ncbi:hypothetical protein Cadr_000012811 [Camelus dromedarius]|uniref:Uncharacterized protein n=1 Tax=Camelus dromedarius TaxID=9838 RepID=A0A5N4D9K9_CAMDR|nr:hypothetical protein Cadr_000012811 [Camelus dromedarius]
MSYWIKVKILAPNAEQMHIVNHLKESPTEGKRTVGEESARRALGDAHVVADLNFSVLDAVSNLETQQLARHFPVLTADTSLPVESHWVRITLWMVGKRMESFLPVTLSGA